MKLRYERGALMFGRNNGHDVTTNLEGLLCSSRLADDDHLKYIQLYRNGCVEVVGYAGSLHQEQPIVSAVYVASEIRAAIKNLLQRLVELGVSGPLAVAVSINTVKNYKFAFDVFDTRPTDRNDLDLPPVWIEMLDEAASNPAPIGQQIFDLLWQAFGHDACPFYASGGIELPLPG